MDYHGGFPIEESVFSRRLGFNDELRALRVAELNGAPRPRLVGYIIAKNEAANISRALESLSKYVDSIVVLDNGSTDSTVDICRTFPMVDKIDICADDFHEGTFRNRMLASCRELGAEWIVGMDADETLEDSVFEEIGMMMQPLDPSINRYAFYLLNFWEGESHYRIDERWRPTLRLRLFRDKPDYFCEMSPTHSSVSPVNMHWKNVRISSVRLRHWGYSDPEVARSKYELYTRKNPERDFSWLIDHTAVRLEAYSPEAGAGLVGTLQAPLSARFLRECLLAGRWLRRCKLDGRDQAYQAFVEKCATPAAVKWFKMGYSLGFV